MYLVYGGGMQVIELCLWGIMEIRRTVGAVSGDGMECRKRKGKVKEGTHRLIIPQSLHVSR